MKVILNKIDIIITTKNRIDELLFTINHLLNIGLDSNQIYIIDDASEDDTFKIIKDQFPTINIKRNEDSLGYIVNRNTLMKWSSNNYILSLDDDSHIRTREDIEEALMLLENNDDFGIFHFRPFEQIKAPPLKSELNSEIRVLRNYIGCGHIISRNTIERIGYYKEELVFYTEELDFSARTFIKGIKTVTKDNLVVHHRIDKTQRKQQKKSNEKEGVYGQKYRYKYILSNNLIFTSTYYPIVIRQFFLLYRIILNFKVMVINNKNLDGWILGLRRYISMYSTVKDNRNVMSMKDFLSWIKLPLN